MSTVHRFSDSLAQGERASEEPFWEAVYRKAFPGFVSCSRNPKDGPGQRAGIDRWVHLSSGQTLTIDEKRRAKTYPDILLEVWSDTDRRTPGWIKKDLQIDFLAYGFVPDGLCYLLPWQQLRRSWDHFSGEWIEKARAGVDGFRVVLAENPTYTTTSVAVPTNVLLAALYLSMTIRVTAQPEAAHG